MTKKELINALEGLADDVSHTLSRKYQLYKD